MTRWPKFQPHSKNRVITIKCIIRLKFFCKIIVSKLLCLDSRTYFQKKENWISWGVIFRRFALTCKWERKRPKTGPVAMPGDPGAWELNNNFPADNLKVMKVDLRFGVINISFSFVMFTFLINFKWQLNS